MENCICEFKKILKLKINNEFKTTIQEFLNEKNINNSSLITIFKSIFSHLSQINNNSNIINCFLDNFINLNDLNDPNFNMMMVNLIKNLNFIEIEGLINILQKFSRINLLQIESFNIFKSFFSINISLIGNINSNLSSNSF